jgi:hypothetical protein
MIGDGDKFQERRRHSWLWEKVSIDCPKVIDIGRAVRGVLDKSAEMQKDREDETDAISGRPW